MSENRFEPTGVLIVNKPEGITSHDVVGKIRKLFGTRKVGKMKLNWSSIWNFSAETFRSVALLMI